METTRQENYDYGTSVDKYIDTYRENQQHMKDMLKNMGVLLKEKKLDKYVDTINKNFIRFKAKDSYPIYFRIVGDYIYIRIESEHATILLKKVRIIDMGIKEFLDVVLYINAELDKKEE